VKAVITFPYTLALSQSKFLTILKTNLRWLSSFDSLIPLIVSNLIWSSSWRIFGSFTLALRVNLVETFWQYIPLLLELLFFCNALKTPHVVSHHYIKITNKRSNCVVGNMPISVLSSFTNIKIIVLVIIDFDFILASPTFVPALIIQLKVYMRFAVISSELFRDKLWLLNFNGRWSHQSSLQPK